MSTSVHRLHMASVNYLDSRIDVYAYLVVTASDVLLIDTGVGEGNEVIEKLFANPVFSWADMDNFLLTDSSQ